MENKTEKNHKKRKKKRRFRHLNQHDRDRIQALLDSGHKQEEIAKIIDFDPGAVSREINKRKYKDGRYIATYAQHKARVKRKNSKAEGMKVESNPELKEFIIKELIAHRSPDEIAGRMVLENKTSRVATKAIYKWLYSRWGQPYCKYLCTKRYKKRKQKNKTKREMIPNRKSIHIRPIAGVHAQGDLFVSPTKTRTQRSGAVFIVPDTKLAAGTMIEDKKPASFKQAVKQTTKYINVDDLTLDNGIENRNHEQFGIDTYFCDPHSPWQKPHIEGFIGLIRRWFIPKKTDLKGVSEEQFQEYLHILNSKHRKSLGYRSAYEVSLERGIIQKKHVFNVVNNMQKVAIQGKI
jgi:IS30 family transposase